MVRKTRKSRARKKPAPPPKFNGDHGTGTAAAIAGTVVEALEDNGKNPNHMARRRRTSAIEAMTLTMRQEQAAKAIEEAFCRLQMVTSGGPLQTKVDASPKPDAVVTAQVNAQSRWIWVTAAVPRHQRSLVYWVCCLNKPVTLYGRSTGQARAPILFKEAMDKVADRLGY